MATIEYHDGEARSGANRIEHAGSILRSAADGIARELSSDSPWSNDKIGSGFAQKFDPDRQSVIKNVSDFAKKVESYEPAITEVADQLLNASKNL
ncbi:hypothetical protein [Mycobacteroides abscessus]|jgi:hypothetical protein|uniref:hypothetical protein n=1 Tax=Mycobacteroides abscessus TaxID=36809 RepID=UPI0002585BAA|nr:hypothetical protein [Mycobacteroides abscessus]AMU73865.1 hypothetical protein A3O06_03670 [Mycobacteroides abscessus]ANO22802.1 hypothetical protein BAB79_03670 [Mycobacteroides abscessus]EIC62611.1 hypothetical protein OUW_21899 [Mycobacteroides abscessus M93]MBN7442442.1 hypothetical protein [Mycobacteroides abscessus subsp. abscessus]MBN7482858.1 hypothetical protein [Mycobacteroides abscessus subsp. massiliense]